MDNVSLKSELQELRLLNNSLQQSVVQLKTKIGALQNTIIHLTEPDNSGDALSSMVTQNKDFKNKYLESLDLNQRLEAEVDSLKKQLAEAQDLSFARGGFHTGGGGVRGSANFDHILNASSIQGEDDIVSVVALPNEQERAALQQRVATLEDEIGTYRQELASLRERQPSGKQSQSGLTVEQMEEQLENYSHVKIHLLQLVQSLPVAA